MSNLQQARQSAAKKEFRDALDKQVKEKLISNSKPKVIEPTSLQLGDNKQVQRRGAGATVTAAQQPSKPTACAHGRQIKEKTNTVEVGQRVQSTQPGKNARQAYKEQLDAQVKQKSQALLTDAQVSVGANPIGIYGFKGMGNYSANKTEWKNGLDQQRREIQDARDSSKQKPEKRAYSAANKLIQVVTTTAPDTDHRDYLLQQMQSNQEQKRKEREESLLLDRQSQGLVFEGQNTKQEREELKQFLLKQINDRHMERTQKHSQSVLEERTLGQKGLLHPEYDETANRESSSHRADLLKQMSADARRTQDKRESELRLEREHRGLSLGEYVPHDKHAYRNELNKQMEDKTRQLSESNIRKRSLENQVNGMSHVHQYSRGEGEQDPRSYLLDLQEQIQGDKVLRDTELSERRRAELNATGLKLQPRITYDKSQLKTSLMTQIQERDQKSKLDILNRRQSEKNLLNQHNQFDYESAGKGNISQPQDLEQSVLRRQAEQEYLMNELENLKVERAILENTPNTNLAQELAKQADSDRRRKLEDAERERKGGCSLILGEYKPVDRREYGLQLRNQMAKVAENKRNQILNAREEDRNLLSQQVLLVDENYLTQSVVVSEGLQGETRLVPDGIRRKNRDLMLSQYLSALKDTEHIRKILTVDQDMIPEPDVAQLGHSLILAKDGVADSHNHSSIVRKPHQVKRKESQISDYELVKNVLRNEQKIIQAEINQRRNIQTEFRNSLAHD